MTWGAGPAGHATGAVIGIQDDRLPVVPIRDLAQRLDRIAESGATLTRVDVLWSDVAPSRPDDPSDPADPAYRWARYDRIIDGLAARGVTTIICVYRTPRWAGGGPTGNGIPRISDYAGFVRALARRYSGSGAHARVDVWEAWNEPNIRWFLHPQWSSRRGTPIPVAARAYGAMLRTMFRTVREEVPGAVVLGASAAPTGQTIGPSRRNRAGRTIGVTAFLGELARLRVPMDGVSQHLYPADGPARARGLLTVRGIPEYARLADRIRPEIPIWITEFGYMTRPTRIRSAFVRPRAQATYLTQAFRMLAREPRVVAAVWFNLQDNQDWTAGLFTMSGAPKPAWSAFLGATGGPRIPGPDRVGVQEETGDE